MSLLAHTALLAQQAFGPLDGVGTALAGWAVDDPDRHRPKPPVVDGDTLRLFGDTRVYLVADHTQSEWSDHEYIHMLHDGREMSRFRTRRRHRRRRRRRRPPRRRLQAPASC